MHNLITIALKHHRDIWMKHIGMYNICQMLAGATMLAAEQARPDSPKPVCGVVTCMVWLPAGALARCRDVNDVLVHETNTGFARGKRLLITPG